jgi:hypothetical protein
MSFLPFVLTFLLILTLGSSLLFQSFSSTSIEKTIILAKKQTRLNLRSEQARKGFKALQIKAKEDKKEPPTQLQGPSKEKAKEYIDKRALRKNKNSSKFNLWPLVYEPDSVASKILYKKAITLIEMLYGQTDFYKTSTYPKLATALVDAILGQKKEDFIKLFPKDPELSKAFYKMLKGTNTGYPRFEEYFKIEECKGKAPICFAEASIHVLTAVLGEKVTSEIKALEKKKWEVKPKERVLTKEELVKLFLTTRTDITDQMNLEDIFSFTKPENSLPKAYVNEKTKIMSMD